MNIARPPGGFSVVLADPVRALVDDVLGSHPELEPHWRAVIARLRAAAHTMGEAVTNDPGQRAAILQPSHAGVTIWLVWHVLGDTVTILKAQF
jgi:hypothetical protein